MKSHIRMLALGLTVAAAGFSFQALAQQGRAQTGSLTQQDTHFLENAIQGSYAEIAGSKLALEKSQSADVKDFANKMIEDHGKMVKQATALAKEKGYTPPDGPSVIQKGEAATLKALSGGAFDAMYVNRIGVAAHESTVQQFEQARGQVQDADIKAMIDKALPTLKEHLNMARELNAKQDSKS